MIRTLLIAVLSGLACLFLVLSIAAFTIGSTSSRRPLFQNESIGTRRSHWETKVYFISQKLMISHTQSHSGRPQLSEKRDKPVWTITEWGCDRLPTFKLTKLEMKLPGLVSCDYLFGSTAHSLLLVACVVGVYPAIAFFRGPLRRRTRRRRGQCIKCGYNLAGNTSGTCPECGESISN